LTNSSLTVSGGGDVTLSASGNFTLTIPATGTAVLLTATQTLTNKTLTTPTIGDFSNATHDHEDAAGGGQLSLTAAVSGILPPANGGTGVNNDTRTLTINTNSGTLAFGAASKTLTINENLNLSGASGQTLTLTNSLTVQGGGNTVLSSSGNFTLTVPKTCTVPVGTGTAGRIAEWVTDANTVQASTLAKTGAGVLTLSAAGAYTLTIPATGTAALLGTANVFTAAQTFGSGTNTEITIASATNNAAYLGCFNDNMALAVNRRISNGVFVNTGLPEAEIAMITASANSYIRFKTANVNNVASTERMRIDKDGNVLIGSFLASAQLHVDQSSATGAKPALRLRQADLSEELIRFDATVGTGNPINTTALGAYYGRVRVWVEGVGEKWLALYNT
jgi:hypothetical protein